MGKNKDKKNKKPYMQFCCPHCGDVFLTRKYVYLKKQRLVNVKSQGFFGNRFTADTQGFMEYSCLCPQCEGYCERTTDFGGVGFTQGIFNEPDDQLL